MTMIFIHEAILGPAKRMSSARSKSRKENVAADTVLGDPVGNRHVWVRARLFGRVDSTTFPTKARGKKINRDHTGLDGWNDEWSPSQES